jgi:tetratricopeptide (TPR) repeat protein/transcriptional regulator with XRE-family HTH domain
MDSRPDKTRKSGAKNPEGGQVSPLGWAILYFREEQGLTRAHLAEQAGIDEDRILEIETGKTRSLQAKTLKAIANGLGLPPDDLRAKEKEFAVGEPSPATTTCSSAPNVIPIGIMHNDIRPVPGFTGREDLLADIDAALWQKGGTAALTNSDAHAAAVKGLGGVGKSVLARQYAWRARERYYGVWWVRAETEQTLMDDLIELGSRLIPNLKGVAERDRALHLALDAIATASGDRPWLIVYDNVAKPGAIARLTPKTGAHILITSRWPRWQGHAQELPVDVFPEETAVDFLLAERPHETREAASRLAAMLGYLPLAISHARAYCAETNLSFDDYARRLSELIQEVPEDAEYPASVFATFSLAIAKATAACPEAEKLMEIVAFLAPERIPLDIITEDVMSERLREQAVASLFRVSLITHDALTDGSRAVSVHRLAQEVMRARLGDYMALLPLRLMHEAFAFIHPFNPINWLRVQCLLPHAVLILEQAADADMKTATALRKTLGLCFQARGDYATAASYFQRALAVTETELGKDHPDTGKCLEHLAILYLACGRYSEAEPMFQRAISIAETVHGKDHYEVGRSIGNLAAVYYSQGRYAEAEPLIYRALTIAEIAHGRNDLHTGSISSNLGALHFVQGNYAKAEPLYQRALDIAEAVHGKDHPAIGSHLFNLAEVYLAQDRAIQAEPLCQRAIAISETIPGKSDPITIACLREFAELYQNLSRYEEAEVLYHRSISIAEALLGGDNIETSNSVYKLARLYLCQDRYDAAEPLCIRALAIAKTVLGEDHCETGARLHTLADVYVQQGRYVEAEPYYIRALAITETTYGQEHLRTGSLLVVLANLVQRQSRYGEAAPLYLRASAIFEKLLGYDHPIAKSLRDKYRH